VVGGCGLPARGAALPGAEPADAEAADGGVVVRQLLRGAAGVPEEDALQPGRPPLIDDEALTRRVDVVAAGAGQLARVHAGVVRVQRAGAPVGRDVVGDSDQPAGGHVEHLAAAQALHHAAPRDGRSDPPDDGQAVGAVGEELGVGDSEAARDPVELPLAGVVGRERRGDVGDGAAVEHPGADAIGHGCRGRPGRDQVERRHGGKGNVGGRRRGDGQGGQQRREYEYRGCELAGMI